MAPKTKHKGIAKRKTSSGSRTKPVAGGPAQVESDDEALQQAGKQGAMEEDEEEEVKGDEKEGEEADEDQGNAFSSATHDMMIGRRNITIHSSSFDQSLLDND